MRLLAVKQIHLPLLVGMRYLVVESQEFGQREQFVFHTIVNDTNADILVAAGVREIKDTGRTVGMWQRLGGSGVLRPQSAALLGYDANILNILSSIKKEATLSYEGKTWRQIILSMSFADSVLTELGIGKKKGSSRRKTVDKKSTKSKIK